MTTKFERGFSYEMDNLTDRFFDGALPNATAFLSDAYDLARVGGKIEIAVFAENAFTAGADLVFESLASDDKDGTYAVVDTQTFAAGAIEAHQELYRYSPDSSVALYFKTRVTTTTDESANSVAGKIVQRKGA